MSLALVLWIAAAQVAGAGAPDSRVEDFALLDHRGDFHRLYYYSDAKAIVLFVQGNACPIARSSLPTLSRLRERFESRGVVFLMLNANPQDDRARIAEEALAFGIDFPVLVDETQLVAEALGLERTAEALLIDPDGWGVRYRGPVDDRVGYETQKPAATRSYLAEALEAQLAGRDVADARVESPGCLIFFPDADRERNREISYADDVVPILRRRCALCHHAGGVAPWAMTSYAAVRGWSSMMREVLRTRRMPPWHADPGVGRLSHDLSLRPDEMKTLVHWIEAGALPSDADPLADDPPTAAPEWPLGPPDLILKTDPQRLPATGVVDYRYERVALPVDRDLWLRAVDLRPTNPAVMHHGTAFIRYPLGHPDRRLGERRLTRGLFAAYVPGRAIYPFPEGTGFLIPKGSSILFQLHYTPTGRPETDTPRLGLYLADGPLEHELRYSAAVNTGFRIPPGAKSHAGSASHTFGGDTLLYRLTPHMHYRGKSMRFEAHYPDGSSELLLSVPRYDFNWQRQYELAEPKAVPAGTRLVCRAEFDNSTQNPANPDATRAVYWGEQSFDEMLIGYFLERDLRPGELAGAALASRR